MKDIIPELITPEDYSQVAIEMGKSAYTDQPLLMIYEVRYNTKRKVSDVSSFFKLDGFVPLDQMHIYDVQNWDKITVVNSQGALAIKPDLTPAPNPHFNVYYKISDGHKEFKDLIRARIGKRKHTVEVNAYGKKPKSNLSNKAKTVFKDFYSDLQ